MYPADSGTKFDVEYYLQKHMPLVKERWASYGLKASQVLRGTSMADGSTPGYRMMAVLTFNSIENYKNAGKAHGREIFADIANFTDAKPSVQINDILA